RPDARWSPGRTFPDTGRSSPSLLPVQGQEAVSVAELSPAGPVYRNRRPWALLTPGQDHGPPLRGKPSRVEQQQAGPQIRIAHLVRRIEECDIEGGARCGQVLQEAPHVGSTNRRDAVRERAFEVRLDRRDRR